MERAMLFKRDAEVQPAATPATIRLLVVFENPPGAYSGASSEAIKICCRLLGLGVVIGVISESSNPKDDEAVLSCALNLIDPANVTRVKPFLQGRWSRRLALPVSVFRAVYRRRDDFDLLLTTGTSPMGGAALLAARAGGRRGVAWMQLLGSDDPLSKIRFKPLIAGLGWLSLAGFACADAVISVSAGLSAAYKRSKLPLHKLRQIPNSVDVGRFRPANRVTRQHLRESLGLPTNSTIVTFVGHLSTRKGVDTLLAAWAEVRRVAPNSLLMLIGPRRLGIRTDHKCLSVLESLLADRDLSGSVVLTGTIPEDRVIDHLRASDIFVLPSTREGLPLSLLEAMSCGLPCLSTTIPGVLDVVQDGVDGVLVRPGCAKQLASALSSLIVNPNLRRRIGAMARLKVQKSFSSHSVALQHLALYREVLQHPAPTT